MKSLRIRLLLGTLSWIALSLLVAALGLSQLFKQHISEQFYTELQLHLDQLTANLEIADDGELVLTQLLTDPRFSKPLSGYYWQVDVLEEGGLEEILRSRSLWDQRLIVPSIPTQLERLTLLISEVTLMALVRSVEVDELSVQLTVAANESFLLDPLHEFQRELGLALSMLGGGLVLAALFQVWIGISPLRRLRNSLQQVREGKSTHLKGHFPQEIMFLIDDFNTVLSRNEEMIVRAQTQAGNLAHALKTPLAILNNAAYAEPQNSLSKIIQTQVSSAHEQVDYHLKHARAAANAQRSTHALTSVAETLAEMLPVMRKLHQDRNLEFELQIADSAIKFRGEQKDLQEMLGNLLDNACKWATTKIQIKVEQQQQRLLISIEDDGQGVPAGLQQQILQRGVRADEKVQGSGLGLAIVADLAQLYQGNLQISKSTLGGLKAQLIFSL